MSFFTDERQGQISLDGQKLEDEIYEYISVFCGKYGLTIIKGKELKRYPEICRHFTLRYGKFGRYEILPDTDLVIFNKKSIILVSVKRSIRERWAQTAFWKTQVGKQILHFFVTPDIDKEISTKYNKARVVLENVIDGIYITHNDAFMPAPKFKHIKDLEKDLADICGMNLC